MKIKFWGCRGSIPVPDSRMVKYGGNTACVEVGLDEHTLIIDAGTGIRKLGENNGHMEKTIVQNNYNNFL